MRVDAKITVGSPATAPRRAGSSTFRLDEDTAAPRAAAGSVAASMVGGIDALLVLQGEGDATEKRRRAARHGRSVLDALDQLKAAILGGRIAGADLVRIRDLIRRRPDATDDPRLDEILAHIELRAEVELAKLGR